MFILQTTLARGREPCRHPGGESWTKYSVLRVWCQTLFWEYFRQSGNRKPKFSDPCVLTFECSYLFYYSATSCVIHSLVTTTQCHFQCNSWEPPSSFTLYLNLQELHEFSLQLEGMLTEHWQFLSSKMSVHKQWWLTVNTNLSSQSYNIVVYFSS